jgi:hypothetical protein
MPWCCLQVRHHLDTRDWPLLAVPQHSHLRCSGASAVLCVAAAAGAAAAAAACDDGHMHRGSSIQGLTSAVQQQNAVLHLRGAHVGTRPQQHNSSGCGVGLGRTHASSGSSRHEAHPAALLIHVSHLL